MNKRPIEQRYLYPTSVASIEPTPAPTPSATATPAADPNAGLPTRDTATGKLLVFPGAKGFGVVTPAGRGGQIIKVTNLNSTGPGSFKEAVEATGPRTVVFEVSGTIQYNGFIRVTNPYLTVAGQTAPSPGITIRGATIEIETHDVLIQHLRFRTGDGADGPAPGDRDNITLNGNYGTSASSSTPKTYNVVIDHCSLSWSLDENFSTWYPGVNDITLSNSIIAEGLLNAGIDNGQHSTGLLVGDHTKRAAIIGNYFAHNDGRNPLFKGDTSGIVMNNFVYDPGYAAVEYAYDYTSAPMLTTIVGNVFESGPSTKPYLAGISVWSAYSGTQIYRADNLGVGMSGEYSSAGSWVFASQPPLLIAGLTPAPSSGVKANVLKNSGARPADRDAVDIRVVGDALNHTGKLISATTQVGGWPSLAQNYRVLALPSNPGGDDDGDGYTNLEEMLQQMAASVEGRK